MCLKKVSLPQERMGDFDLDAFVRAAGELNQGWGHILIDDIKQLSSEDLN